MRQGEPYSHIGSYQVIRRLGSGAAGTVYLARTTENQLVAIKVLAPFLQRDPAALARFQREYQAVSSLSHAHIIRFLEYGRTDTRCFIAMEYLTGGSLADRLRRRGAMAVAEAVRVIRQVGAALAYLHRQRVVHRDLKPSNILFDDRNRAIVSDFGVASLATTTNLTIAGQVLGTPLYMAPEQATGQRVDYRVDIYALGAITFEMLTGRPPFVRENDFAVLHAHVNEPPPLAHSVNPGVPPRASQVVRQAMAKNPAGRPQSADAFVRALSQAAYAEGRIRTPGRRSQAPGKTIGIWLGLGAMALVILIVVQSGWPDASPGSTVVPVEPILAFVSDRDHQLSLYLWSDTAVVQLSGISGDCWSPAWSPDGRRLAFTWNNGRDDEIVVISQDGSKWTQWTQLTDNTSQDSGPSWSPDGRHIAFDSLRDGDSEIFIVTIDGQAIQQLTNNMGFDGDPAWSPDGQRIAFESDRQGSLDILLMDRDGGNQTHLTRSSLREANPAWSPDGKVIAYECGELFESDICLVSPEGANLGRLTDSDWPERQPAWSPDGNEVAFARQARDSSGWDIYRVKADGAREELWINLGQSDQHPAWRP